MRRARPIVMGLIASSASIAAALAGCVFSTPSDCEHELVNCPTGSTSSTSSSSGTGGGGGDGGIPPGCIPSESNPIVDDTCGVFVSGATGDDANLGTKDKPLKTLGAALMKGNVIYARAGATPFDEALIVKQDAAIYGALDCTKGWAYDASKKTQITAAADMVPLTVSGAATDVTIADIIITAVDAIADGGSSIAILVDQAELVMNRVDVIAGNGRRGLDGMTPIDAVGPADPNDPAIKGNDGKNACMDPAVLVGGLAKENTLCPAMSGGPLGGSGGIGQVNSGTNGEANPANAQTALGGQGQPNMGAWDCSVGQGSIGTNGMPGTPGTGATDMDFGIISASGFIGAPGLPGALGLPGQGGGGGGGAKGKSMCAGASGGGGGVGGCGGHGGTGGQAGGASIGILSVGGTITMMSVSIQVGIGGDGGDGGDGQLGGSGGSGGNSGLGNNTGQGLSNACDGGNGGQGGKGGRGGGGRGGHAIGIAHKGGTAPSLNGATFVKGTAGLGGFGDNRDIKSAAGRAKWSFTLEHLIGGTTGPVSGKHVTGFGDYFIDKLETGDIEQWKEQLAELVAAGDYAPTTVNTWMGVLRVIMKAAKRTFDLPAIVTDDVGYLDTSEHDIYTDEEPNALLPAEVPTFLAKLREFYPQHFAMAYLGLITGLRPSTLRPLRRNGPEQDVDWNEHRIRVRCSHTIGEEVMRTTKQQRRYTIDLPAEAMNILQWHVDTQLRTPEQRASELLFPASDGRFRSASCLKKAFAEVAHELGLTKHVTPRALRRTFNDLTRAAQVQDVVTHQRSSHRGHAAALLHGERRRTAASSCQGH